MKTLSCELCGSNEIVKKDGMFECAHCGTKYSADEAKKLFVTVDNTQKISNSLEAARKARDMSNWASAAKHYDEVLGEDPDNWEAIFFSSYCVNRACKIGEISSAGIRMMQTVELTLKQIKASVPAEEQPDAVETVAKYTSEIGVLLYNSAIEHYNGIGDSIRDNYTGELNQRKAAATGLVGVCATLIHELFKGTEAAKQMLAPAKTALTMALDKKGQDALLDVVKIYDEQFVEDFKTGREAREKANYQNAKAGAGCCYIFAVLLILIGLILLGSTPVLSVALLGIGALFLLFGFFTQPKKDKNG